MLSVVTWKWKSNTPYHSSFTSQHVNILKNMVKRNLDLEHEFCCITDDPAGIDPDVRVVKLWESPVPVYGNRMFPNCFRRLKIFSKEITELFPDRILSLDLDLVITGNITSLFDNAPDFKAWKDPLGPTYYNGSMIYMKAGARSQVWESFRPEDAPKQPTNTKLKGSDQGWISHVLGPKEAMWTKADGIYSLRQDLEKSPDGLKKLPNNTKIVVFHGIKNPWDMDMQRINWIKENYR